VANELDRLRGEVGAVVAAHEAARGLTDFTKYADDPIGFLRDVLRCDPWSAQVTMAELVRDNPRVCVVSANSMGKDWLFARLFLWWVYARRGFVICGSVTDRQARQITMREVRRAFLSTPSLPGELFQMELRVDDSSGILAFTSDAIDRLVGFHHPRLFLALSEGQGLEAAVLEAAHACATSAGNKIAIYGNPTRPDGPFHSAATSDNWKTLTVSASQHPNIVNNRDEIPGGPSVSWIRSMAEEYGETSSIYRSRVLAEWPEEAVEGLLKRAWILAAFDRHDQRVFPNRPEPPVFALDVARFGPDASVLADVRESVVESLTTWRGASITESADRMLQSARFFEDRIGRPTLVIDEPGLGGGCIDVVRTKGWKVNAFNGASQPKDLSRFLNLRAQSHWRLRELLEQNIAALPRDEELLEELLAIEWQLSPTGKIQIISKDDIRKTLGRSPDRADAVVMGLWTTMGPPAPRWGTSKHSL
jgi:phage terminase large subunit